MPADCVISVDGENNLRLPTLPKMMMHGFEVCTPTTVALAGITTPPYECPDLRIHYRESRRRLPRAKPYTSLSGNSVP